MFEVISNAVILQSLTTTPTFKLPVAIERRCFILGFGFNYVGHPTRQEKEIILPMIRKRRKLENLVPALNGSG